MTKGEERLVFFQYDKLSSFYNSLFLTIIKADKENLAKLKLGFPEEVQAYENYTTIPNYWDNLKKEFEGRFL